MQDTELLVLLLQEVSDHCHSPGLWRALEGVMFQKASKTIWIFFFGDKILYKYNKDNTVALKMLL